MLLKLLPFRFADYLAAPPHALFFVLPHMFHILPIITVLSSARLAGFCLSDLQTEQKTVGHCPFAGEGVDPLMHKQETPTAIIVESYSFILLCI